MRAHYDRVRANSPYFDSRLSWSPAAWVYRADPIGRTKLASCPSPNRPEAACRRAHHHER
jgi:hypothetical protein